MKKAIFTNDTDVRLGFEIECIIRGTATRAPSNQLSDNYYSFSHPHNINWTKFCREIRELKKSISIGDDHSINSNGFGYNARTAEIRTPPLAPKDAMEVLKSVFDIVNKYGATNSSCGFHVNISSVHKNKMLNFNPLPFLSSNLWDQILKKFNRAGNKYCKASFTVNRDKSVSKVHLFRSMIDNSDDKYHCVNLNHFGNGMNKLSRVEIRGFGNKDYTKKYDTIARFVKRIEKLFRLSCDSHLPFARTFNV